MCTWDFCFIKPCQCLYHLVDNSIIFSGKITCNAKICREKNVKLTNWRHPYFPHFCWMVWGAGKFVFKTARVYRVISYNTYEIQTRLKTYFKFMTARHPLLRVLSAYRDKLEWPNRYKHYGFGRIIAKKYGHIADNQSKRVNITFEQFVHFLIDSVPADYNHHFRPIAILCNPCHISYDYIAKLETSYEDYPYIFAQIKNLPDSKRSALEDMRKYKAVTDFGLVNEYYKSIPAEYMTIFKTIYNLDALLLGCTWNSTSMSRGCRIKTEGKECC